MTIYYAKLVTTSAFDTATRTLSFYIASNSKLFTAKWDSDVNATVSSEHNLTPTLTSPTPVPSTGWLWLSRAWVDANGVYSSTDPKRPKAFGIGDIYYQTHGTIVGVEVMVVLDEDKNQSPVRVNVYDGAMLAQHHPRPSATFGEKGELWLSSSFLTANADVDFSALPSESDSAAAASKLIAKLAGIEPPDPAFIRQYQIANRAAQQILDEYAAWEPDLPPDATARWNAIARAGYLDRIPASRRESP
jgi:hypothetical protein